MMQLTTTQHETDIDVLEVRNYRSLKWISLVILILFVLASISILVQMSSKSFWVHFKPASIYYFIALPPSVFAVFYYSRSIYYDRWVQLKVDREGIWTQKYKTWKWQDIWYFGTSEERVGSSILHLLQIKLKDGVNDEKNSLTLPLDNYDKSIEEIVKTIEKYAVLNGVQNLGNEIIS